MRNDYLSSCGNPDIRAYVVANDAKTEARFGGGGGSFFLHLARNVKRI
jgi:hypothetical protein